jgi:hypothetical protein
MLGLSDLSLTAVTADNPPPVLWSVSTATANQSIELHAVAGKSWQLEWGDGTETDGSGTGAAQTVTHTYTGAGPWTLNLRVEVGALLQLRAPGMGWVGTIPSFAEHPSFYYLDVFNNLLTGSIPNLGALPAFQTFIANDNQLSGYTGGTLPTTLVTFNAANNLLTQAAVSQALAELKTVAASLTAVSPTFALSGTGNATATYTGCYAGLDARAAKPTGTIAWHFPTAVKLWARSDLGITIATGVSRWNDQSAVGNNLLQADTTKQMVYHASGGPNNRPYLAADGSNDYLQAAFALTQPHTVVAVVKPSPANKAGYAVIFDGAGGYPRGAVWIWPAGSVTMEAGAVLFPANLLDSTKWHALIHTFSGVSSIGWVNGIQNWSGNAGTNNPQGVTLAARGTGIAGATTCDSQYAETLVISGTLTTAERNELLALHTARYGVLPV